MDRLAVIRQESDRFAEVLADTDPAARCPSCPDWTAADLLWHLTEVQHFWAGILAGDARTDAEMEAVEGGKPSRPDTVPEMLPLRARGTEDLLAQLTALADDEPRWSWWPPEQTVGFTRRMQTYEATMHRVDAELAAGLPVGPIAADVAAGAVGHCVEVMWGWTPPWATFESLAVVEFRAADVDQQWQVDVGHWTGTGPESGKAFDEPSARPAGPGARPSATVDGTARDLALWAWGRGGQVRIGGDEPSVAALEALIANGIQ